MTQIQVEYLKHLETVRSNKAREAETARANRFNEGEQLRHNYATEIETMRKNLASEGLTAGYNEEVARHNAAVEAVSWSQIGLDRARIDVQAYTAEEQGRHNVQSEYLQQQSITENMRHNVIGEVEQRRHNEASEQANLLSAYGAYLRGESGLMGTYISGYLAGYQRDVMVSEVDLNKARTDQAKSSANLSDVQAAKLGVETSLLEAKNKYAKWNEAVNTVDNTSQTIKGIGDTLWSGVEHASSVVKDLGNAAKSFTSAAKDATSLMPNVWQISLW